MRWLPAFTAKSQPQTVAPLKEWHASVQFLNWLRQQFVAHERPGQALLFVGDGHYDNLQLWQHLPDGVTLLFWAWQRWAVEVAHRELKTTFGLGHKQCFNPKAAALWVQWSAWVYSLLLLTGFRTFGLARAPDVPTCWWRRSGRWSFATLLRSFRAALWGHHHFRPIVTPIPDDWVGKQAYVTALKNTIYALMRALTHV